MRIRSRQTGITFISTLALLVIAGFFVLLALKLGPIYLENYTIRSVLENIKQDSFLGTRPASEIRRAINDRLYINEVRRLKPSDIELKREGEVVKVQIDYSVKEHILGNVDVLVSFSDKAELRAH
jgi:hypothetical protein